jgi:hypothetical protein
MSIESGQLTLTGGADGEKVEIDTSGRVIRPLLELPSALVNEAEIMWNRGGMYTAGVDAANVAMFQLAAFPAAFDSYELHDTDELTVGADLPAVQDAVSDARLGKRTDDPVALSFDGTHMRATIRRDYSGTEVTRTAERMTIDPAVLRDLPDIPSLGLDWSVSMSPQAFKSVCDAIGESHNHIKVAEAGGRVVFRGVDRGDDDGIVNADSARVETAVTATADEADAGAASLFSLDYMADMADALVAAKLDTVRLTWGDELPIYIDGHRTNEDDDTLYSVRYLMAPRRSDSS